MLGSTGYAGFSLGWPFNSIWRHFRLPVSGFGVWVLPGRLGLILDSDTVFRVEHKLYESEYQYG